MHPAPAILTRMKHPILPAKVTAKIYLITAGSVVKVPVKLEAIKLP